VRLRWHWLAGAMAVAAGLAVTLTVLVLPAGRAGVPGTVAAVARYAQALAPRAGHHEPGAGQRATPTELGRPATMTAGGQQIVVRTWLVGRVEAVVAVSARPFPMPPGAQSAPGGGMAWSARAGKLGLYCVNGHRSELMAAPVPAAELPGLVARLPFA
jgi:hypothetical protein